MTTTQTAVRESLCRRIVDLPDEKAARVMVYIQSLDEEPDLTDDEKKGIHTANLELAGGEGRSFKEALNDLW